MRLIMMAVAGMIALIIVATGCAVAQDRAELEVDHALTLDFPTPHTDWAQPYALGTTRVLFFTDGRGTSPRECVELLQRFDIDAEAVFWARIIDRSESHWHGGEIGEMRMVELLGQQWDCYVFMGVPFTNLSAEQQYKVLRPIAAGAGLVMVGANDERILKTENLIGQLPAPARAPSGDAFSIGKGRGARLPAQPDIPYHNGWEVEYDYWAEKLGYAILWAAGHEPKMTLRIDTPADDIAWDATKTFTLDVRGDAAGNEAHALMRVRTAGGPSIDLPERALPGKAFSVQAGALPAGDWHFDAWVVSSEGVETWATVPFTVTASPALSGVLLDAEWGETGDMIAGKAMVAGAPMPTDAVRVGLFDRRNRLLKQELITPAGGEVRFEFEIEPWMPMLVRVDAALLRNLPGDEPAMVIDSADAYVRVTRRQRDKFNFLMWDTPRGALAPYAEESLVDNSVTLQLGSGNPALMLSAFDVSWVPYTTRVMANKVSDDGIMKPFCWNDEEAVNAHVQAKADEYGPTRQHGAFVWSLGDEVQTQGSCLSPHCAEAYRDYLDLTYGSLDALNASWGTNFANWDQVGLSKEGDNLEANSLAEGNYPRWFDRKAFQSYNFVQFCGAFAEVYSAIDPEALTGFEGAGRFSRGDDLDLIVRSNGFWSPYPGVADEVIRSIAPRDFPRSNWMGYTKDADSLLSKYWRMVTRGNDAVWWWRWEALGRFHGWLAPDLRPYPAVKEILADTQIVRDGLGDLLLKSEMLDDEIAVLYSYPSTLACELEDGASYGSYESAHVSFHEIIRDLGYQFSYVTDRMLRLGEFEADKYRMLILPRIEALGEQEAEVIREYVRGGGVVIADVRPAIYDGHCKPLAAGLLDEIFGIATDGRAAAATGEATLADGGLVLDLAKVDPTVSLTTGVASGDANGVPLMITNRYGDGAAILLNFAAASFPKLAVTDTEPAAAKLMADLISRSGNNPAAMALLDASGERLRNIELTRWQDGDTQIVSLFRQSGTREPVIVTLPQGKHVYDLRNHKYLGQVKSFETEIIPFRASFFALCEAATPTPAIVSEPASVERGQAATVSISVPGATGLRAFRVTAMAGSTDLDWLDQVVIAGAQPVQVTVPVAFNDPTGEYKLSALELFSNESFEATLRVK